MIRFTQPRNGFQAQASRPGWDPTKLVPNEAIGRIAHDETPLASFDAGDKAKASAVAFGRLIVEPMIAPKVPAISHLLCINPRLYAMALERLHLEAAAAFPDLAWAFDEAIVERRGAYWPNADLEFAAARQLPEYRQPPSPAPTREPHSKAYLEAAGLAIGACHKLQIPLATLDPLRPDDPPQVPLDARAAGPLFGEPLLKLIESGRHLGFAPHGRRAMPPSIDVPGHAFVPLQSGAGWVFSPIEVAK